MKGPFSILNCREIRAGAHLVCTAEQEKVCSGAANRLVRAPLPQAGRGKFHEINDLVRCLTLSSPGGEGGGVEAVVLFWPLGSCKGRYVLGSVRVGITARVMRG